MVDPMFIAFGAVHCESPFFYSKKSKPLNHIADGKIKHMGCL